MDMRIGRRALLQGAALALGGQALASELGPVDLALARRRERWLHHPSLGDPSWDTFEREPGNPIYMGKPPYEWPVNGYLFRDPRSGRWFVYASVYPRGYWGQPGANTMILREKEGGGWEELGLAFPRDADAFYGDGKTSGATTDACVVYADGVYWALIGWANPANTRGGLALARAPKPEGPFAFVTPPVHDDAKQKPILGRYVRAYASTLVRRRSDWLIVHMMSTPGNGGGTWGLFAMTGASIEGPYSEPAPLLLPQSDKYHPAIAEFFPAYVHAGRLYAPATSVARNRTYQSVFSAPIEEAHRPEAWRIEQLGSVWHAEAIPSEAQGIWGQTFSAQEAPGGILRAMFPAKTRDDRGAIHLARRPLARPYRDGFVLSAPNGPSRAVVRGEAAEFLLRARVRADGPWAIAWQCRDPLGPDQPSADSTAHALCRTERVELRFRGEQWSVVRLKPQTPPETIASGSAQASAIGVVEIAARAISCQAAFGGVRAWDGALEAAPGRIELLAEAGTILRVDEFALDGAVVPTWEPWLATEALAGAGAPMGDWAPAVDPSFRYGLGFVAAKAGARAKWNYAGAGFRLWAPRGPGYGKCRVKVDGRESATLDLSASVVAASQPVYSRDLPVGLHAVVLEAIDAAVPLDTLDVRTA